MIAPTERSKMSRDVQAMVAGWKRAGFDVTDMPHELLMYAMICMWEYQHSRESMLDDLDSLIEDINTVKERVAVNWEEMMRRKAQRGVRVHRGDEHPVLFPVKHRS